LGPEVIRFIDAGDSPIGKPLLAVANEISGTMTLFEINHHKGKTLAARFHKIAHSISQRPERSILARAVLCVPFP
jgi:hypothetical protein